MQGDPHPFLGCREHLLRSGPRQICVIGRRVLPKKTHHTRPTLSHTHRPLPSVLSTGMSPSDYATVEVGKYRPENLAGMVLRACVPSLPTIIFRPEAQGRPLSEVTARDFSQSTHCARRA